ncbi:MAG: DNA primase, partial [Helicobacter sp.]|nr:DNA primase [Helicobacter sp.]
IKPLNKEYLKRQMIMVLYKHYQQKVKTIPKDTTLSWRERSFLLRKYQKYLEDLKKGNLIVDEGF